MANLNIGGIFGGMGGALSKGIVWFFWGMIIVVTLGLLLFLAYRFFKNRAVYSNKATLTYYYDNGTSKTMYGLIGGKCINPSGVFDWKIKIPKQAKPKMLGYVPDMGKADSDGTLHFTTSGDGTIWQQTEWKIVTKQVAYDDSGNPIYDIDLLMKPIRTDVKTVTVNSIKSFGDMINGQKMKVIGLALGAFVILAICFIAGVYLQTKIKCSIPANLILPLIGLG